MYFKSREGDIESGRWERVVIQIPVNATQDEIDAAMQRVKAARRN